MASANTAPARLTNDSSASDSSPTEPVRCQASVLSTMVTSATATEPHSSVRGAGEAGPVRPGALGSEGGGREDMGLEG